MSASSTRPEPQVARRARERVARRRRLRFVRQIVFFAIVTAAMVFVIVVQRDTRTVREYFGQAEHIAELLQQRMKERGGPPGGLVLADPGMRRMLARFRFNAAYAVHASARHPVAVYVFGRPVSLLVRPDGRPVVLFDGERFEARWFNEDQLRDQARSLGIDWLLEP